MFIPIVFLRLVIVFVLGLTGLDLDPSEGHDLDSSPGRAIVAVVDEGPATTGGPSEPDPEPIDEPTDSVEEPAEPGKLTVDTGNISLPLGVYDGAFTLTNTGGSALEWTWVGDPRIDLSEGNGVLGAGESVVVSYEVDPGTLNVGENLLANCVIHDDGAVDVWITLTKPAPLPTIPAHLTS